MRGGPDLIKNVAAREPAKSCEGARGESRRPKRYKNRGFETSRKMSKKVSFRRSGRPDMSENGKKRRFPIRFGLPRSSSFCAFFLVLAVRSRSENRENASFLRVSRLLAFLGSPSFCPKTRIGRHLMGVWIGGVWNGHFPESEKYFSEAEISRKMPEILQQERFCQISGSEI